MNVYIAYLFGFFGFLAALFKLYESLSNRKPKIVFFFDEVIDLYKSTINVEGLQVLYNDAPIKKNLYLLNYIFLYSGVKDILANDFNKGIELSFKGDGNILSHNIISNPSNVNLSIENHKDKSIFKADLIKDEDFFTGEILVEYNDRVEDPTTLFNVNSRIINMDTPKLYNYRYVKIENDTPIFDWVVILTGPIMIFIMLISIFFNVGSTTSMKHFSKDGVSFDVDSLITEINYRCNIRSFLKEQNLKNQAINSLHKEDLKFIEIIKISDKINAFTQSDLATESTENNFLGFLKSDTFILGNGYKVYYEKEDVYASIILIFFVLLGATFMFNIGYKANKNRLLDVRLRRLYIKYKKLISDTK